MSKEGILGAVVLMGIGALLGILPTAVVTVAVYDARNETKLIKAGHCICRPCAEKFMLLPIGNTQ